jgi:ferritin-like metal-binding protein YciE
MKMESLHELFMHGLKDIYDAEHQITEALPKMAKAAKSSELKDGFRTHLQQTQQHIQRLEKIFEMMGKKPTRKKCKGMAGLIKEGDELMKEDADRDVLDAGLIAAAQKVEHYEMAEYGTLRTYARLMGHTDAARLLQQTLDEEGETDKKLTALAERSINVKAMENGHERAR